MRDDLASNVLSQDVLAHPIGIAFGAHAESMDFKNAPMITGEFIEFLHVYEEGPKDGLCMLQGQLRKNGQRLAISMESNYLLMLDADSGQPVEEIEANIRKAGLFAIIYPSYSNGKTHTSVAEKALASTMKKRGRTGVPTADDVIAYMVDVKKARPALFEGATVTRELRQNDGHYLTLQHKPWAKHRIVMILAKPYRFIRDDKTLEETGQEWRERYAAIAQQIGVEFDKKCCDPSRLLYTPRHGVGVDPALFQTRVIPGRLLDLESIVLPSKTEKPAAGASIANIVRAAASTTTSTWEPATNELKKFAKIGGKSFRYNDWLNDNFPEVGYRCPWHADHTDGGPNDKGFKAWDGTGLEEFNGQCSHTCSSDPERGQGANGKQDRLKYLDGQCQAIGIEHAVELLEYCDDDVRTQWDAAPASGGGEWEPCGPIEGHYGGTLYHTHKVTGDVRYNELPSKTAARNTGHRIVWRNWSHDNQYEMAGAYLMAAEAADPKLFKRAAGKYARLIEGDGGLRLDSLDKDSWTAELHNRIECRTFKPGDDDATPPVAAVNTGVALAEDLQKRIRGSAGIPFPVLNGFIRTPVFGPDGVIRTERGYQADLQVYLDPRGSFLPVSTDPATEEIRTAFDLMAEAFVDFPFSDEFEGDSSPYKVGEPDPVTGYRRTNPARGLASRWNTYGALLHTQVFHLLPPDNGAPAVAIVKAVAGEGAGLYMNTLNMIANGTPLPIRTYGGAEEFAKGIPAALSSGDSIVGADNIVGTIDDTTLAAMLTSSRYKARAFRSNEREVDIVTRAQWLFAGNGFSFSAELAQRMVPVRLDSGYPRPAMVREARPAEFFLHVKQMDWLRENRPRLVWALHTLIAAWFAAGEPVGSRSHPRFPSYSAIVGGILEHSAARLGMVCHYLGNLDAYLAADDDETDVVTTWAQAIWDTYKQEARPALELLQLVCSKFTGAPEIDIGVDVRPGDKVDAKRANKAVKDILLRKPVQLKSGLTVRLVRVRERNPVTFALVPVGA